MAAKKSKTRVTNSAPRLLSGGNPQIGRGDGDAITHQHGSCHDILKFAHIAGPWVGQQTGQCIVSEPGHGATGSMFLQHQQG